MKPEDAEEYTQALGQVVAGGWRQVALGQRLGVPQALGLTVEQWVSQRLGGYVRMSIEERKPIALQLDSEGYKQADIAAILGVHEATISRDLHVADARTETKTSNESDAKSSDELASARTIDDRLADLDYAEAHRRAIEQERAAHPEMFVADDLFDELLYMCQVTERWERTVGVEPGTKTHDEWDALLNRLHGMMDFIRRLHESINARQ